MLKFVAIKGAKTAQEWFPQLVQFHYFGVKHFIEVQHVFLHQRHDLEVQALLCLIVLATRSFSVGPDLGCLLALALFGSGLHSDILESLVG